MIEAVSDIESNEAIYLSNWQVSNNELFVTKGYLAYDNKVNDSINLTFGLSEDDLHFELKK